MRSFFSLLFIRSRRASSYTLSMGTLHATPTERTRLEPRGGEREEEDAGGREPVTSLGQAYLKPRTSLPQASVKLPQAPLKPTSSLRQALSEPSRGGLTEA